MDEGIPTSGVWQDGFLPVEYGRTDSYQWSMAGWIPTSVPLKHEQKFVLKHEPSQYLTCITDVKNKRTALQD